MISGLPCTSAVWLPTVAIVHSCARARCPRSEPPSRHHDGRHRAPSPISLRGLPSLVSPIRTALRPPNPTPRSAPHPFCA
jgi:hypothetical protein